MRGFGNPHKMERSRNLRGLKLAAEILIQTAETVKSLSQSPALENIAQNL